MKDTRTELEKENDEAEARDVVLRIVWTIIVSAITALVTTLLTTGSPPL